ASCFRGRIHIQTRCRCPGSGTRPCRGVRHPDLLCNGVHFPWNAYSTDIHIDG
ncbi:hypothetical protein FRC01_012389, partial [Tulasnella sp. 417]